jgi:hypothetical protein
LYQDPAACDVDSFRLPLDALEACEGRDESVVEVASRPNDRILLSWIDHGIPRQKEVDQPKAPEAAFPELPADFASNEPHLWDALRDAVAVTDASSTRYALGCLRFRGKLGRFDATDGRQALTQSGFQFGFQDDLLIPASPLLGCRDLSGEPVALGRSDQWVAFRVGKAAILLRIQQEGRFPQIDELLTAVDRAPSRLDLSKQDAEFLLGVLPSLPTSDPLYLPITVDLNGRVLIRCREADRAQPTEVELTSSRLQGKAVVFNTDRRFIERAIRMGFRAAYVYSSKLPVHCADERRRYLWAVLDADSAVPKSADAVRIESSTVAKPQTRKSVRKLSPIKPISAAAA